jgi:hypothetical protein
MNDNVLLNSQGRESNGILFTHKAMPEDMEGHRGEDSRKKGAAVRFHSVQTTRGQSCYNCRTRATDNK